MYHSHHDSMTQQALGLTGLFIIHPRNPADPKVDRDFAILLHEWKITPDTTRPNPLEMMDFNVLTMNGKVYPATEPFEANNPGNWIFHCHMLHHMMNQMGHKIPNMIGVKSKDLDAKIKPMLPSYMTMGQTGMEAMAGMEMPRNTISMLAAKGAFGEDIDLGGMANILKIRLNITNYEDPGWYQNPKNTQARPALAGELERDGVDLLKILSVFFFNNLEKRFCIFFDHLRFKDFSFVVIVIF